MQVRFTIYALGREIVGKWMPYDRKDYLMKCAVYADNEVMYQCEFQRVEAN